MKWTVQHKHPRITSSERAHTLTCVCMYARKGQGKCMPVLLQDVLIAYQNINPRLVGGRKELHQNSWNQYLSMCYIQNPVPSHLQILHVASPYWRLFVTLKKYNLVWQINCYLVTEDERQKLFHHRHLINIPHNTFMKELLFDAKFNVRVEGVTFCI